MTPKQAGNTMNHARRLLRLGVIDRHAFVVFEHLMWSAGRKPFADEVERSYAGIQAAARCSRALAVRCVALLVAVGLIAKERRAFQVPWHAGGSRNVQLANRYRLLVPDCESAEPPARREASKKSGIEKAIEAIWARRRPCLPLRTVEEQLAMLR